MDCVTYEQLVVLLYKVIRKEDNTFTGLLRCKQRVYNDVKCVSH